MVDRSTQFSTTEMTSFANPWLTTDQLGYFLAIMRVLLMQ